MKTEFSLAALLLVLFGAWLLGNTIVGGLPDKVVALGGKASSSSGSSSQPSTSTSAPGGQPFAGYSTSGPNAGEVIGGSAPSSGTPVTVNPSTGQVA